MAHHAQKALPMTDVSRMLIVPFAAFSMPNGIGRAVGRRTTLYDVVANNVVMRVVVMVMLIISEAGPEQNQGCTSSVVALTGQANILAALIDVHST